MISTSGFMFAAPVVLLSCMIMTISRSCLLVEQVHTSSFSITQAKKEVYWRGVQAVMIFTAGFPKCQCQDFTGWADFDCLCQVPRLHCEPVSGLRYQSF